MGCGASSVPVSKEELGMRKAVMTAAKTNDMDGVRKAIDAIKEKFNDPEKTRSACDMWDHEDGPERFMMALKWAAQNGNGEMCKFLIECGAEIDVKMYCDKADRGKFKSPGGVTALGRAALAGQIGTVRFLVKAGADPNYRDCLGHSAADLAGMQGHGEVQKYLKSPW